MSDSESDEPPVRLEEKVEEAGGTLADLHKAFGHHLRREESGESASEEEAWATAAVSEGAPRFRSSAACPRSPRSHYARTREDQVSGEGGDEVSSLGNLLDAPHDRMVSGNKDEPADAHLVDTLCKSEEEGESEEEDGNGVDGKPAYSRRGCPPCTARRQRRGGHVRTPTIYKITSPSGKVYVGQTVWPAVRLHKHSQPGNGCPILGNAVEKYGWDAMKVEILRGGTDAVGGAVREDELDALEVAFIQQFDCLEPNGYNVQKGGKVAWRGLQGLSRTSPRGPRSAETVAKIKATWERKRNARLADLPEEESRRLRHNQEKQAETRLAQRLGVWENGKHKSTTCSQAAERKREAKLALLAPDVAAKERERMRRNRERAMAQYVRKGQRTPGNFDANS